jgi:hypothetical protein
MVDDLLLVRRRAGEYVVEPGEPRRLGTASRRHPRDQKEGRTVPKLALI